MNRYAVVEDLSGIVSNVALWDGTSEWRLEEGFSVVQSDDAAIGSLYVGGAFKSPDAPATPSDEELSAMDQASKLFLIASTRYTHETAGITIGGILIDTSDRSKTLINGSALKAIRNDDFVLRWKTADGFVDLSAVQVLAIADAVSDYVQACFDREEVLQAAVKDGTYTDAMLTEGWPVGE